MARGKYPLLIKKTIVARFLKNPESTFSKFCKKWGAWTMFKRLDKRGTDGYTGKHEETKTL